MTSVAALRLRPDRSFERLYRRHAGTVYRFALALLRDPHEAEAATQDAFAAAYRALQDGERPARAERRLPGLVLEACREREPPVGSTEGLCDDATPTDGPIGCRDAELAVSRALDGLLARREQKVLAIHLASCSECAAFSRRQEAQRTALQALTDVPVPPILAAWTAADSTAVARPA
jgi:DNA-directed RNA polymerase specialized sigma24 family protein